MNGSNRYTATNLGSLLKAEGRQQSWLARQLGISESLMSKVILRQRTIDERLARQVATILGVDIFFIFELRSRSEITPDREETAA